MEEAADIEMSKKSLFSLEELLSLLSGHTSDYKVLDRKTQNAAGNLQIIKRLRVTPRKSKQKTDTRDMIKILGNKAT